MREQSLSEEGAISLASRDELRFCRSLENQRGEEIGLARPILVALGPQQFSDTIH